MTKSETRENGMQASVHLVRLSRGVAKTFVSAILAQYFRRCLSTSISALASDDLSRVEALSRALGDRQAVISWLRKEPSAK
jgi:hypothetical protein